MQKKQSEEDYRQEMLKSQQGLASDRESQPEEELSLEEAFGQIEEVISRLEAEEITLEQSFQEYNRGMKLLQYCNEKIDRVEKKVLQISEDGGLDEY